MKGRWLGAAAAWASVVAGWACGLGCVWEWGAAGDRRAPAAGGVALGLLLLGGAAAAQQVQAAPLAVPHAGPPPPAEFHSGTSGERGSGVNRPMKPPWPGLQARSCSEPRAEAEKSPFPPPSLAPIRFGGARKEGGPGGGKGGGGLVPGHTASAGGIWNQRGSAGDFRISGKRLA